MNRAAVQSELSNDEQERGKQTPNLNRSIVQLRLGILGEWKRTLDYVFIRNSRLIGNATIDKPEV
jgi:hypothetical protein